MDIEPFIDMVRQDCERNNITLNLSNKDHVMAGGLKCNGFFDGDKKMLAVATGQEFNKWIQVFVHEYCHMTQWKDQCQEWKDAEEGETKAENIIDLWFAHSIELTPKQLKRWSSISRDLELDCEKRSLKMIKAYSLPLSPVEYVKKANAYVYFWTYLRQTRKWYDIGKEPYNNMELVHAMPDHFDNDYEVVPEIYKELFNK